MNLFSSLFLLFSCASSVSYAAPEPAQKHYARTAEIKFGGTGGWDDLTVDSETHQIFLSHSDRIVVIDLEQKKVIKEITDTPGIHGIALASDLGKAFSSDGKEGKVGVINLKTLTLKSKIAVGENPDAIIYIPRYHEVYAFNGKSKSVSILDAQKETLVTTVDLPGKPEFAVYDASLDRVYVNIEDKNLVLALDAKNHTVAGSYALDGCDSPSGIALDEANHRTFSACENQKMVVLDVNSGKTLASIPIGEGADGAAFDPGSQLIFSPNGKSGTLTIAREKGKNHFEVIQTLKTEVSARTITLNKKTHELYLPAAKLAPAKPSARPKPIDGTQTLLIIAPI